VEQFRFEHSSNLVIQEPVVTKRFDQILNPPASGLNLIGL
jgi:hypothetical protein